MKITENTSLQDLYDNQTEFFLKNLNDVEVEEYPFTHLESNNFFTEQFFEYMKRIMPEKEDLLPLSEISKKINSLYKVSSNYSNQRSSFVINDPINGHQLMDLMLKFPTNRKKYVTLHKWFSNIFLPNICKKLNVDFKKIKSNELMYVNDDEGYKLGPHTDVESKIITILIYMPDNDDMIHCGTNLLINEENKFKTVKTSKFIRKNTLAFVKSDKSWHSVSKFESNEPRKLLLFAGVDPSIIPKVK